MGSIVENRELRGRRSIFQDRKEAGKALATLLEAYRDKGAIVLAIPSGGLPVAAEVVKSLDAQFDVVIVRKLQTPRNPEAGFGAISLNGDTILNQELIADLALTDEQIDRSKENALREGRSRERALRGDRHGPDLTGRIVILVDDGLASGYTMLAAIRAVKAENPSKIVVAVPTGSDRSVELVAREVDQVFCLNIREMPFAVADAYRNWYDVDEKEAVRVLRYGIHP
ncbi:MAG: phosphoribosyltransferase family protein [Methanomassiliicoccales archaeon]|jgi:predicted phosphoribosyltransferase